MNKRQFILNKTKRNIEKLFSKRRTYIFLSYLAILTILFFILYEPITHTSLFGNNQNSPISQQVYYNSGSEGTETYTSSPPLTYSEIPSILTEQSIIQDLPKDTIILLKFYNFDTGERQWEKSYILKKGSATEGDTNEYDLFLYMHSKYLQSFNSQGLCGTIQSANKNGDLGVESDLSNTQLAWKFKSIMEYRSCFGL